MNHEMMRKMSANGECMMTLLKTFPLKHSRALGFPPSYLMSEHPDSLARNFSSSDVRTEKELVTEAGPEEKSSESCRYFVSLRKPTFAFQRVEAQVSFVQTIYSGGNGDRKIHEVLHEPSGAHLAMKTATMRHVGAEDNLNNPHYEAKIFGLLHLLPQEGIVEYGGWVESKEHFETEKTMKIFLELCKTDLKQSDFLHYVLACRAGIVQSTAASRIVMLLPIFDAVDYMHNTLYLAHRDIKPDNILLSWSPLRGYVAKLTDFGSTAVLQPQLPPATRKATATFGEILENKREEKNFEVTVGVPPPDGCRELSRALKHYTRNLRLLRTAPDDSDSVLQELRQELEEQLDVLLPKPAQREFAKVEPLSLRCGTVNYMAPEVHTAGPEALYDGKAADIWGLGVTLFMATFKSPPYTLVKVEKSGGEEEGKTGMISVDMEDKAYLFLQEHGIIELVRKGYGWKYQDFDELTTRALSLCAQMLVKDPAARLSIRDARDELKSMLALSPQNDDRENEI